MTIKLSPEQEAHYKNLVRLCEEIETAMDATIDGSDPAQIQHELSNRIPYLSNISKMMETATAIYDWAKGEAVKIAMKDASIIELKAAPQRLWFDGQLAKYSGMYQRVERLSKTLPSSVEGLRSLLSYEKLIASLNHTQGVYDKGKPNG